MEKEKMKREDAMHLVALMRQYDEIFGSMMDSWDDIFTLEVFAAIKAASYFFARISQELGLEETSFLERLPALKSEIFSEEEEEGSAYDDIAEYIMEYWDIAYIQDKALSSIGIHPERAFDILEEGQGQIMPQLAADFPVFMKMAACFVKEYGFYLNEVVFLHSERVGRFKKNGSLLARKLPGDLFEALSFLIDAVFSPLYVTVPELSLEDFNVKGEYCSAFTLGEFESGEIVTYAHKRPYGRVAVELLGYFLEEAEKAAPEILMEK